MAIVNVLYTVHDFAREFDRHNRGDQFTWDGLKVLFEYLDNLSDVTGENIELDVIALCCDYAESSIEDLINDYRIDVSEAGGDEDRIAEIVKEYISDNTQYLGETEGCLVYQQF